MLAATRNGPSIPRQRVSYRQIGEADIPNIATLLVRGFPKRNREFWLRALGQLSRRQPPWGLPKYGYVLESDEQAVGVVLVISSASRTNDMVSARCNLSSWYVEPQYRSYAAMFRSGVIANSAVTYLNISADQHIWPIIEAQGFSRYCDGIFTAVPMLSGLFSSGPPVEVYRASRNPKVDFDPYDQEVLLEHAGYGCKSARPSGRVLRPRDQSNGPHRRRLRKRVIGRRRAIAARSFR